MRPRRTARIGAAALRVLAALLLVDGRLLTAAELAAMVQPWYSATGTVWSHWIPLLRRHGCQIETGPANLYGYRLLALPPDDLLEDVLLVAHQLRAEQPTRLWSLFGRSPTTATRRSRTHARAS